MCNAKTRNSALSNIEVIALCLFLHFELGTEHISQTTKDITNNFSS